MPEHSIVAEGLVKRCGDKVALDGFDLAVPAGSVYGLLGPNGAGKTTAVRILATLLRMDGGRAWVSGIDVRRHPRRFASGSVSPARARPSTRSCPPGRTW
jgi:ABC-2 type transport system ATP-binding protein